MLIMRSVLCISLLFASSACRWWSPVFFDLEQDAEVPRPATYELRVGLPACDHDDGEALFAVYHHENTFDNLVDCAQDVQGDHSGRKNLPLTSIWDVLSSCLGSR